MTRLLGKLNEGSLLRRTLLHMGVFVAGSASFVALVSVLLVTTTKAVLPSHDTTEVSAAPAKQEQDAADPSSPEAAARPVEGPGGPKSFAQRRAAGRREELGVR